MDKLFIIFIGIVFSLFLLSSILLYTQWFDSYFSPYTQELEFNNRISSYHLGTHAQKNKMDAYMTYMDYGVLTDYYDINDTKQCYQPSLEDIHSRKDEVSLKKEQKIFMKLFHEAPLNIVIVFLTLISAFYFSSQLARKKNVT